jgi:tetratricopeptide (TPR) repeat protein
VAELKLAQQLDPLSVHINTNLGRAFYFGRRYDEAIDQLQKAIELDPNFWIARIFLGLSYVQQARNEEALAEFRKTVGLWPGALGYVAYGLAVSGKKDEALKVLAEFKRSKSPFSESWAFATLYTALGEKDQALHWLEKSFDERFVVFASIKTDPVFDSLRSDPRFADLLKRSGLAS